MRVLFIDDHQLFLDGLSMIFEELNHDVVTAISSQVALEILRTDSFDVIFCDMLMPGLNGIMLLKALRERGINTHVIMISSEYSNQSIDDAIQNGARGYISKAANKESISSAIASVKAGNVYIQPELNYEPSDLKDIKLSGVTANDLITKRQVSVLELVNGGYSNKEIAVAMNISEATVKTHLNKVFQILNVKNRTSCIAKAKELEILTSS